MSDKFALAQKELLGPPIKHLRYNREPPDYLYDWEDIEAEIFELFWSKISQVADSDYPKAYCWRMVMNYYRSYLRVKDRESDVRSCYAFDDTELQADTHYQVLPIYSGTDQNEVSFEFTEDKVLTSLFPKGPDVDLVIARLRENYRPKEIAFELQVSEMVIKKRYRVLITFFWLRNGYSVEEISSKLGCSKKTVLRDKKWIKEVFKAQGLI